MTLKETIQAKRAAGQKMLAVLVDPEKGGIVKQTISVSGESTPSPLRASQLGRNHTPSPLRASQSSATIEAHRASNVPTLGGELTPEQESTLGGGVFRGVRNV